MSVTAIADDWWARDFACTGAELRPAQTRVQEHTGALLNHSGIWILVAGGAPLVSLPTDTFERLREPARAWSVADVANVTTLARQLADLCPRPIEKIVGPAFIAYGSAESLHLQDAEHARPFCSLPELHRLRDACPREEWEHGGSDPEKEPTFGVVDPTGVLVALSGYEVWDGAIAHISIVTHPLHRGRGHGRAAVALAARHALAAGLVPQYRTLRSNTASLAIAQRLGFVEYGFSVSVRLRQT